MLARIAAAALLLGPLAVGQPGGPPPLTTIQDVVFKADGTRFNGILEISWTAFVGGNLTFVAAHSRTVRIIDGNLLVKLTPTTTATPAAVYTVRYNSDGRVQFTEFWAVPPSSVPLKIREVRTTDPFPGGGGGNEITLPIQQSDVVGLVASLAARATKGAGFTPSHAAVINASGEIEGALGDDADCVRVDGSAGPCNLQPVSFIDAETPSGTINGVNAVFTLANAPAPATSLSVYRNGVQQRLGGDYTFSGQTVTFLGTAIPQTGDVVLAYYRLAVAGPASTFADGETPGGVVNGVNTVFTLQAAPNPATSLLLFRNGILQRLTLDYTLSGNTITFTSTAIPQSGAHLVANYRF